VFLSKTGYDFDEVSLLPTTTSVPSKALIEKLERKQLNIRW
jgi:hypothetical protein